MASEGGKGILAQRARERPQTHHITTTARVEFKDITSLLQKLVKDSGVQNGMCYVYTPHTTAAVLINENDDPALQRDLDEFLKQLAPRNRDYQHSDGNCDAHLKSSVIGCSKVLLIEDGQLVLGRWQGVFLCEFDGPRRREVRVKIISD